MKPEDVLAAALAAYRAAQGDLEHRMRAALAAAAPLIQAEEREACAQDADYYAKHSTTAKNIAAAIRARGGDV